MTQHSKFPPSSAARRVACPGSRALEAFYPEAQESPHAREGEAAHWLASEYLKSPTRIPEIAPNGVTITEEMHEGAELYASAILTTLQEYSPLPALHIEERVDISTIHPECWGTPDCWFYDPASHDLHVFDYKFGHGLVDAFENWQLIEYVAGILDAIGINGITDNHVQVSMYIIQPRGHHREGPIRVWRVRASELRALFNILRAKEAESERPDARTNPSPECHYCTARHACEALQRSALTAVDVSGQSTPWQLSPHDTGNELRYLKRAAELLDARITGLEEQITAYIRKGDRVPFFRLEQLAGRERWKKPIDEVIALGDLLDIDLRKPPEAITPKQAADKGIPREVLTPFTERPAGSMKLVLDTEHNTARKIFGGEK